MSIKTKPLSRLNDEEVLKLYEKHNNNASSAAREAGCGPSTFRERIKLLTDPDYLSEKEKSTALAFLEEELACRGIDPREVKITKAKISTDKGGWEAFHKDIDGKAVVTPLKADRRNVIIEFSPSFDEGPKWPVIQPAQQIKLDYQRPYKSEKTIRKVLVIPDCQIGYYRHIQTGVLEPFHDIAAITLALQAIDEYQPEEIVILGDFLDLPSMSKYIQLPEFQLTLQPSLDFAYKILSIVRTKLGKNRKITFIPGNHEKRISAYIASSAMAAYGIRKGGLPPESWPILTIPNLLRFDELNINFVDEYPGGQHWLTPELVCTHAPPSRNYDLRASVLCGHEPQADVKTRTVHYFDGRKEYSTYKVPGLMRVDEVSTDPFRLSRTSVPSNMSRPNWQQGFATVNIFSDSLFEVQIHRIMNGQMVFGGKLFVAS